MEWALLVSIICFRCPCNSFVDTGRAQFIAQFLEEGKTQLDGSHCHWACAQDGGLNNSREESRYLGNVEMLTDW
eukprot:476261-Amphidinium_carterae.2